MPPQLPGDRVQLVTIIQAADLCRVTRRTIYNWLAQGRLDCVRTAGGSIRIDAASLFRPSGIPGLREHSPPSAAAVREDTDPPVVTPRVEPSSSSSSSGSGSGTLRMAHARLRETSHEA